MATEISLKPLLKPSLLGFVGCGLLGVGFADSFFDTHIVPVNWQFDNYGYFMMVMGGLFTIPFHIQYAKLIRANKPGTIDKAARMFQQDAPTDIKRYDYARMVNAIGMLAALPFWIIVYKLNLLPILFPSYSMKEMYIPVVIFPGLIVCAMTIISGTCKTIIANIDKNRFPMNRLGRVELPLNDLLFEYFNKKSYWKLSLVIIICAANFIGLFAGITVITFGFFICFKYNIFNH
ncbi:MAG: hypothetical protein WDM70_11505 [Nitrosomonadales bacterium]